MHKAQTNAEKAADDAHAAHNHAEHAVNAAHDHAEHAATAMQVPVFSLQDQNGKTVNLADYADKTVVLEWTNPQCPVVVRHYNAHTMTKLAAAYKDKGIIWLAINSSHNGTVEANLAWAKQNKIEYPVLDDHTGTTGRAYQARVTPHMFVIHKGKLVYQGAIDNDLRGNNDSNTVNYVASTLDAILAGKSVPTAETKPYGCSVKYGS